MCAEKVQRLIQASILGFVMCLAGLGMAGDTVMLQLAFLLQLATMIMLVIAGITGWCPGLIILKKIFPSCEKMKTNDKDN